MTTQRYIGPEQLEKVCTILKAIAHPVRMSVIELLERNKEMSVGDLQEHLSVEQAALSHHLITMKDKGILQCRREGKNMLYSLKEKRIVKILECMADCEHS